MAGRFSVEAVFKAVDRITAPVNRMQNRVGKFTRGMEKSFRRLDRQVKNFGNGIKNVAGTGVKALGVGVGAVTGAVTLLLREFSKVENAQAAFTPLLGGAEKAKKLVQDLNKTAASTPFQFETLADTANQLLPVMNGNIDNTIKTLRMLGDTAGGNAQKLDSITRGFTKAMLKGKVDLEALNMIGEAGVPIFGELAETMGTEVNAAFFKMISAGKVTTKDLTKAFEKMTSKGGVFFKGMEIASKTTSGMFSTLKDNVSLTAATLGSTLAPVAKELIGNLTEISKKLRVVIEANRELITVKVREYFTFIVDNFQDIVKWAKRIGIAIAVFFTLAAILKTFIAIMTAVNLVMALNPVGLVVIGIVALIAAITAAVIWWDELKAAFLGIDVVQDVIAGAVGAFDLIIAAAVAVRDSWEPLKAFFIDLWDGIIGAFSVAFDQIMGIVGKIQGVTASVKSFFGFGNDDEAGANGAQVISPQERTARSIEEKRQTSTAEVTIKDDTGRAEVTGGSLGPGLKLQSTGAF